VSKQAIESSNPVFATKDGSTIFKKFSYSPAVRAGDFIYVAGQVGLNPDGSMPDSDEPQIVNAFDRMKIVLEEAGASLDDIVELVSYHVGLQKHLAGFIEIKNRYIREPFPTWTILEIAGLARPGLVIEIKAVAYAPKAASR
jgi:enamine deaminase RidA (YjgF/YER057c/UK114 family)